jgi:hypothetical protein
MSGGITNDAALTDTAVRDLLKATQENLPLDGGFEVLQGAREFEVTDRWFAPENIVETGGTSISRRIHLGEDGSAKFVALYEGQNPTVVDRLARINAPWRYLYGNYTVERHEILQNRSSERIVDIVKDRRVTAKLSIAEKLEQAAWSAPASSSDRRSPFGIPYWCVPIESDESAGFNGTHETHQSNCGGIDATDDRYARWRNYNDRWMTESGALDLTDDDVSKVVRAMRRMHFRPPQFVTDIQNGPYANRRLYACEEVLEGFEELARASEDDIGPDVARYAGATLINNVPIVWVEQLDDATWQSTYAARPMYIVDHARFRPFVLEGDRFRESDPINDRSQPHAFTTFISLTFNFLCLNRRMGAGVISQVAAE